MSKLLNQKYGTELLLAAPYTIDILRYYAAPCNRSVKFAAEYYERLNDLTVQLND